MAAGEDQPQPVVLEVVVVQLSGVRGRPVVQPGGELAERSVEPGPPPVDTSQAAGFAGIPSLGHLVIDSQGSTGELTGMSVMVAEALPDGTRRSLAGAWHGVPGEALAPVLTEFFRR